jgi:hypothetical protein
MGKLEENQKIPVSIPVKTDISGIRRKELVAALAALAPLAVDVVLALARRWLAKTDQQRGEPVSRIEGDQNVQRANKRKVEVNGIKGSWPESYSENRYRCRRGKGVLTGK